MRGRARWVAVLLTAAVAVLGTASAAPAHAATCGDGVDNDADGRVDYADRGCDAPADTSEADPAQRFGFNDSGWNNPGFSRDIFMQKMSGTGPKVWRLPVHWHWFEPTRGQVKPDFWRVDHDPLYQAALARGIRPIFVLLGSPAWARTTDSAQACAGKSAPCMSAPNVDDPYVMDSWRRFAGQAAARYPWLAGIEVWNEPNIPPFWHDEPDPSAYGRLLTAAAEEVRRAAPHIPVVLGGVNNYKGPNTTTRTNYTTWLSQVYSHAGAGAFDVISYHAYPCPNETAPNAVLSEVTGGLRGVRDAAGDATKDLWLTEVGATTSNSGAPANCGLSYTEQAQATVLGRSLDWVKGQQATEGDLPVVTVHTLMNPHGRDWLFQPTDAEGEFGIVAWAQTPLGFRVEEKPAYARVACEFKNTC